MDEGLAHGQGGAGSGGTAPSGPVAVATQKLVSNTGDAVRSPVGSQVDLALFNGAGQPMALSNPVTVTLPYADGGNGFVAATPLPVRARTLSVYWLDETRNAWRRLPSSRVDESAHTVSALVPHFTAFGVIGQSAMAFATLLGAFSLVITQFQAISSYASVIARLSEFVEHAEKAGKHENGGHQA